MTHNIFTINECMLKEIRVFDEVLETKLTDVWQDSADGRRL